MYRVQLIDSREGLKDLRKKWSQLLEGRTRHRPFIAFDWFTLWLDHFPTYGKIQFVVVHHKEALRAVVPLVVKQKKHKGVTIRKLELMGNLASPIKTILLAEMPDTKKKECLKLAMKHICDHCQWDVMEFDSLPGENFPSHLFEAVADELGISVKKGEHFKNFYFDEIEGNGDWYVNSRVSHIRKNVRMFENKCKLVGKYRVSIVARGSDEEIDAAMNDYYQVLDRSWKEWEIHPTFHRSLAKLAGQTGCLRLGLIYLEDRAIAGQLWLVSDSIAYIVRVAYDQEYRKFSPGVMLSCEMMKYVIDEDQVVEIDYLIGDESYKEDWLPQRRTRKRILLFHPKTLKGRLFGLIQVRLVPTIKSVLRQLYLKVEC